MNYWRRLSDYPMSSFDNVFQVSGMCTLENCSVNMRRLNEILRGQSEDYVFIISAYQIFVIFCFYMKVHKGISI